MKDMDKVTTLNPHASDLKEYKGSKNKWYFPKKRVNCVKFPGVCFSAISNVNLTSNFYFDNYKMVFSYKNGCILLCSVLMEKNGF